MTVRDRGARVAPVRRRGARAVSSGVFHDGYIERLIRQIGAIVARVSVGRREGETLVSPQEIDAAWTELLGVPDGLIDVIDAPTLASLLGTADKRRLGAELLDADADARQATDPVGAERRRRLARDLRALG